MLRPEVFSGEQMEITYFNFRVGTREGGRAGLQAAGGDLRVHRVGQPQLQQQPQEGCAWLQQQEQQWQQCLAGSAGWVRLVCKQTQQGAHVDAPRHSCNTAPLPSPLYIYTISDHQLCSPTSQRRTTCSSGNGIDGSSEAVW